jgi:hypothetical protein
MRVLGAGALNRTLQKASWIFEPRLDTPGGPAHRTTRVFMSETPYKFRHLGRPSRELIRALVAWLKLKGLRESGGRHRLHHASREAAA